MKIFPIAKTMPLNIGTLHFVGIGGIGMSGIAEVLHNLGYTVQGSDIAESYTIDRLRKLGMTVNIGAHDAKHIKGASVVVISSAVKQDNPEVVEARAQRIPVVRRAEMLAELMRLKATISVAGTHGKTTTTSLISTLLKGADMNPTVINGGIINAFGTNAFLGEGEWMVVEADESDGTFIRIPSTVAVITNIDPEHLDHYGDFEALKAAFHQFITQLPFYGFGVLCIDHPEVQALIAKITDRRIISYGTSPQADVRAVNITQVSGGQTFDVEITDRATEKVQTLKAIELPMYGLHNVRNTLAAIAVARELGMSETTIKKTLKEFGGVKRRFTKTGEVNGVTIIDDYGHHPVEIMATLSSARQAVEAKKGKVIAVIQPHRYTRFSNLFKDFCTCADQADTVLVADVYTAGEDPIEGANRDALVAGMKQHGHKHVLALPSEAELAAMIAEIAQPNDFVICLGAGSISKWAYALPAQLEPLMKTKARA
ncbi:MAG: UDP-N-acetylmuramate--L-alanine ligase [Alphaproteobacteria bacterium]|nr:UDP-N-acetylmuramate--L-alanine ligase [Alphaproteobacteria bacterium]